MNRPIKDGPPNGESDGHCRGGQGPAYMVGPMGNVSRCLKAHWRRHRRDWPRRTRTAANSTGAVAVCVLGQIRSFGVAFFNIHWALHLAARRHHLFFVGPADQSWRLHKQWLNTMNSTDYRYERVHLANLGPFQPLWQLRSEVGTAQHPLLVLNVAHARALRLLRADGRVLARFVNMVVQLWQQTACVAMVRAHERRSGMAFTRVIKARPDLYLFQQMPFEQPKAKAVGPLFRPVGQRADDVVWPRYRGSRQDVYLDATGAARSFSSAHAHVHAIGPSLCILQVSSRAARGVLDVTLHEPRRSASGA